MSLCIYLNLRNLLYLTADIEGLRMEYDKLVDTADVILSKLAAIK